MGAGSRSGMRGFISALFLPAASEAKTTLLFPTPGCAPPGKKAGKEKGGVGIVYAHVWLEQNSSRVLHHSVIFFPVKSPIASLTVNQL